MEIPKSFKEKIVGAFGEQGEKWLDGIEEKVGYYAQKWNLEVKGPVPNLSYNFVAKVKQEDGSPAVLKLGVPGFDFENEVRTIGLYNGEGCAKLLKGDAENGAMLLEQLVPGNNLSELADEEEAIFQFICVWKSIRKEAPNEADTPSIMDWAEGLEKYQKRYPEGNGPIPGNAVEKAMEYFKEFDHPEEDELLHGDLHHENILFSEGKGWLAIDPKGVTGDRHFDLVSFLVNHLHEKSDPKGLLAMRIEMICRELELGRERLLKASIALGTLYACWGTEDLADWENTYQCVLWFNEFLESTPN